MSKKKKIIKVIKLQIEAGKANPAPPIGPALGSAGVKIMDFCQAFNKATAGQAGDTLPVEIFVYQDKTFDFKTKQPPVSKMILKKAKIAAGSKVPNRDKVGKLTRSEVKEIAEQKMVDMRAASLEAAMHMVMGTARSMGVEIKE